MEKEKGFRYLVDRVELSKGTVLVGIAEFKIIEISETAMKIQNMITNDVYWIYNEWEFHIVERLND